MAARKNPGREIRAHTVRYALDKLYSFFQSRQFTEVDYRFRTELFRHIQTLRRTVDSDNMVDTSRAKHADHNQANGAKTLYEHFRIEVDKPRRVRSLQRVHTYACEFKEHSFL